MPTWELRFGEPASGAAPAEEPLVLDEVLPLFVGPLTEAAAAAGVCPLTDFFFDDSAFGAEIEQEVLRERFGEGFDPTRVNEEDEELHELSATMPEEVKSRQGRREPLFDAADGLATVRALVARLATHPVPPIHRIKKSLTTAEVLRGLEKFEQGLEFAHASGRRFRISPM